MPGAWTLVLRDLLVLFCGAAEEIVEGADPSGADGAGPAAIARRSAYPEDVSP